MKFVTLKGALVKANLHLVFNPANVVRDVENLRAEGNWQSSFDHTEESDFHLLRLVLRHF